MVYTSNRDGGGSVPSGHLAHPPPEGRLRRTGIFTDTLNYLNIKHLNIANLVILRPCRICYYKHMHVGEIVTNILEIDASRTTISHMQGVEVI